MESQIFTLVPFSIYLYKIKKGKCIVESGIFENLEKIYLIYIISHRRKTKVEVSIREFPAWYICN